MITNHFAAGPVPYKFGAVIRKRAEAEGSTFWTALLALAQAGAECGRLHKTKRGR